jgi:glycosyltransferase involved in cell wall biosynthesis
MSGTGSNIYTANVARCWKADGHDVLVVCQEPHPERFDFVDASGNWPEEDGKDVLGAASSDPDGGSCVVVVPDIGDLLPVYVLDAYEGIEAKRFTDLTDDELNLYTSANVEALATMIEAFEPEAIITGHEVMGPHIARLACQPTGMEYVAKLHGSALEYAVKLQDRYRAFAMSGLNAARYVVGGSRYVIEAAADFVPGWAQKARVINPGCDVELFRPGAGPSSGRLRVCYVGKLIASKGVDHLLAALPLLEGDVESVIIGFGGDEEQLRSLWGALHSGHRAQALEIAAHGDIGEHRSLREFIEGQPQSYFERARALDVRWPGRLDHGPLSEVLPTFDVLVAPSVVAEAFGMVAAEAAACGVLPVVPRHSGIGEAGATLERALRLEGRLTFDPSEPITGIASAVNGLFAMSRDERWQKAQVAVDVARELWSWDVVATKLLDLAGPQAGP